MDSFLLAFRVVFPLMIYMMIGAIVRKCGILSRDNFQQLNNLIFRLFIPLSLFFEIYNADLGVTVQARLFIPAVGMILLVYAVSWIAASRFVREKKDGHTLVQGIFRSNFVLFGAAISTSLCGEQGAAAVAALAVVAVPLFNSLAVILFETLQGERIKPGRLVVQILKNPLVDAGLLGGFCNLTGLRIPNIISEPLMKLGSAATPVALVTLGGLLSFHSMASHKGYLFAATVCRLVIVPAVALLIFIPMGFRGAPLAAVLALFASPTAVASVPMAYSMGGNGDLAGEIVALTSVGSILTIFMFIVTLSGMELI